jgi:hypothetical protein
MSRTANCYDNAAMEAFFATLTCECTDRMRFQTRQEARSAIFEYLECFYNPIRLHSTLQYVSPVAFEQADAMVNSALFREEQRSSHHEQCKYVQMASFRGRDH